MTQQRRGGWSHFPGIVGPARWEVSILTPVQRTDVQEGILGSLLTPKPDVFAGLLTHWTALGT